MVDSVSQKIPFLKQYKKSQRKKNLWENGTNTNIHTSDGENMVLTWADEGSEKPSSFVLGRSERSIELSNAEFRKLVLNLKLSSEGKYVTYETFQAAFGNAVDGVKARGEGTMDTVMEREDKERTEAHNASERNRIATYDSEVGHFQKRTIDYRFQNR